MYQLARLGFILVGLDVAITTAFYVITTFSYADLDSRADAWRFLAMNSGLLILGLGPAAVLVFRSSVLARYVFPESEDAPLDLSDTNSLVTAGVAVLGLYVAISGLFAVFTALVWLLPFSSFGDMAVRRGFSSLAEGTARFVVGLLVYRFAPRIGRALPTRGRAA